MRTIRTSEVFYWLRVSLTLASQLFPSCIPIGAGPSDGFKDRLVNYYNVFHPPFFLRQTVNRWEDASLELLFCCPQTACTPVVSGPLAVKSFLAHRLSPFWPIGSEVLSGPLAAKSFRMRLPLTISSSLHT